MYEVEFTPEAEEDLSRISKTIAQRILKKIRWLAENFEIMTPEPLTGDFKGLYKLRVGDYRILYTLSQNERKVIIIHLIAPNLLPPRFVAVSCWQSWCTT